MDINIEDKHFNVKVLSKSERPNFLSYIGMHQCYAEVPVHTELDKLSKLSEKELGNRIVNKCLKYGHHSVIEHPTISFLVSGFVHNVVGQITRHRHLSFSVQSQRYTCERVLKTVEELYKLDLLTETEETIFELKKELVESLLYFRPVGNYFDRDGNKYFYSEEIRNNNIKKCEKDLMEYYYNIKTLGMAPEHCRDLLPQNIRQDFVVTMNARSLLHFCDLRLPKDAQNEIRVLANIFLDEFKKWMPEVAEWYIKNRAGKNKLAP